jgi:hypothetical protein
MMTDAAAWPLAQHVCRTGYADLPASAVESARRDVLDTFGDRCPAGGASAARMPQGTSAVYDHLTAPSQRRDGEGEIFLFRR